MRTRWTVPLLPLLAAALALGGCNLLPHRDQSSTAASAATPGSQEAECAHLRDEIRRNQQTERAAPATSVDEDIVNAAEAKADNRIKDLQTQYEALECPAADLPPTHARVPPVQPAPGGPQQ